MWRDGNVAMGSVGRECSTWNDYRLDWAKCRRCALDLTQSKVHLGSILAQADQDLPLLDLKLSLPLPSLKPAQTAPRREVPQEKTDP